MKRKRVMILGCTGSIGTTALTALDKLRDSFQVVALSAHTNKKRLISLAHSFKVANICLSDNRCTHLELDNLHTFCGPQGLLDMIRDVECDIVLNAISGSPGLEPTFEILQCHKQLALANKESIVMGGNVLKELVKATNTTIFPVDSEHSTIDALIKAHGDHSVDSLILTASGGPFRTYTPQQMNRISIEDALKHPTWKMGAKISIDSATLANKGLEVIEASYLFNRSIEHIEVVIHPQSVVHSFVRMKNGALYAQLSPPDMSLPIMNALNNDHIQLNNIVSPLDLSDLTLHFEHYNKEQFPLLTQAISCSEAQGGYPIAFNASNEVAVEAFLQNKISFTSIAKIVQDILENDWNVVVDSLQDIFTLHEQVSKQTLSLVKRYSFE